MKIKEFFTIQQTIDYSIPFSELIQQATDEFFDSFFYQLTPKHFGNIEEGKKKIIVRFGILEYKADEQPNNFSFYKMEKLIRGAGFRPVVLSELLQVVPLHPEMLKGYITPALGSVWIRKKKSGEDKKYKKKSEKKIPYIAARGNSVCLVSSSVSFYGKHLIFCYV